MSRKDAADDHWVARMLSSTIERRSQRSERVNRLRTTLKDQELSFGNLGQSNDGHALVILLTNEKSSMGSSTVTIFSRLTLTPHSGSTSIPRSPVLLGGPRIHAAALAPTSSTSQLDDRSPSTTCISTFPRKKRVINRSPFSCRR